MYKVNIGRESRSCRVSLSARALLATDSRIVVLCACAPHTLTPRIAPTRVLRHFRTCRETRDCGISEYTRLTWLQARIDGNPMKSEREVAVSIIPPRRFLEAPVARDSRDYSREMRIERD
ncbi:hypothetical protein SFRURICE_011790 [Spodoptera frugiperda]|uniref:SFRICE_003835 n=1 Tax=Spodoptera frugiperda TaxID=7108 RepID=A0A2H1WB15_SPOFR|nr:hypothetical protein SFRURICE_010051 [Spodoptera frugiperda]KAF9818744.1 hypothetical protein SFRURICE_011790 [Spodoptera frugiperda]